MMEDNMNISFKSISFLFVPVLSLLASLSVGGQENAALPSAISSEIRDVAEVSPLSHYFLSPTKLIWQSETGVTRSENLIGPKPGQSLLKDPAPPTILEGAGAVLLDFGVEIQGYVELITPMTPDKLKPRRVRIRFGESAAEAMAELGGEQNAGNDHAMRDQEVVLPWMGKKMVGPSGFRFVRIDNLDPEVPVLLGQVRAVLQLRNVPYIGSFKCDDERLNRIWEVGAYTVHLNMQEYLWDGIKRDRLVWLGDMHPEISTINAVFGFNEVVPKSLDLIRDITAPTEWMNGISSYSMWWIIIHEDWWMHHGNRAYLQAQQDYMKKLLVNLIGFIGEDGAETLDGTRFLDWPTRANDMAVHEGLQAMMVRTLKSGARLMAELGEPQVSKQCEQAVLRLGKHVPETSGRKSPAALNVLAGLRDANVVADKVLKVGGPKDVSTFYGFYVLQSLAQSGDTDTALDFISQYWGAMLDLGATTFWEDFDLDWAKNAAPIDQLVPKNKDDIHGDFGDYCYVGYRHSLCHGWASGPTAWLSQHVLGIKPLEPGCARIAVKPKLGRLRWAEGNYPTPHGPVHVRHERQPDGSIKTTVQAPKGVRVEQ